MILNMWIDSQLDLGFIKLPWYGILIVTGILVAVWAGVREAKKLGISPSIIYDGVFITVPIAIIGARLWYVLFNLSKFKVYIAPFDFPPFSATI